MCNLQTYIKELTEKLAKVSKERDQLRAENESLKERVKCGECEYFIPKTWDCELYTGAHKPDGYCDAGEKK